jgi:hypothetical protein
MNEPQEQTQELDLGLEAITPPTIEIDYEAALAKTKPDFQRMAKLLGIKLSGYTQEEADLKENLVPKIQTALQAALTKNSTNTTTIKPGVSVNKNDSKEERKVKSWRGY